MLEVYVHFLQKNAIEIGDKETVVCALRAGEVGRFPSVGTLGVGGALYRNSDDLGLQHAGAGAANGGV